MSRFLLFALLLVALFYVIQATPVPDDPQQPATNDLDNLTNEAKKIFEEAKGLFSNVNINDAMEAARTYLGQAGDNIRKEFDKISDKLQGQQN